MKKLSAFFACTILIFVFTFLSCSMANDAVVIDNSKTGYAENALYGQLECSEIGENVRTIVDGKVKRFSDYDFYMYGVNSANGEFPITSVPLDSSSGSFSMLLSPCYWNLTVFALRKGETPITAIDAVHSNAILIGNAAADLTHSAASATFTMSISNLTTGGYANFDVILSNGTDNWPLPVDDDGAYQVHGSLKYILSGEEITDSLRNLNVHNISETDRYEGSYSAGPFVPGTYLFELDFYNSSGILKGIWTDTIVIAAGQSQIEKIDPVYVPNVMGKKPEAPSNFYATYYTGSEDSSEHDGTFKLHFNWDDNANNETNFELQLAEVNVGIDWEDGYWNESSKIRNSVSYGKTYLEHPEYISGSTNANNSRFSVYAKLGVQYQARIRAVNTFGESDWVNVKLPSSKTEIPEDLDKDLLSYFGEDYGDGSRNSNCIHRGRITYNFVGGSYEPKSGLRVSTSKLTYFTQMTPNQNDLPEYSWWVGPSLWNGAGYDDSSDDDDLRKEVKVFRYWNSSVDGNSSTRYYDKTVGSLAYYKLPDNLTLYAEYVEDPSGTPTGNSYRLLSNWINWYIDDVSQDSVAAVADSKRAMVTVSRTSGTRFDFKLLVPSGEKNFSKMQAKIFDASNNEVYSYSSVYNIGLGFNVSLNLNDAKWVNGLYEIEFTGEKENPDSTSLYEKCYVVLVITD
ncbi:hypothetical protein [Treponema sp.]|uniref:hypothetical protein n=1 Tax=Treponema sp. TaxID=166 RepID=UPI00298DECCC|nr:hypothetical protein [Treponema sp.]MCQ2240737.1 hypothetical protein [Treponema sp.]